MEEYIGKTCPFCKTEIKEGDTVKVCPECGIPHHEACWEENKGCTTFGCSRQHYEEQHTNPTDVCANCGAPLGEGQAFCPKCGAAKGGEKARVCSKCGAQLQEGQDFCPKCGQKLGVQMDEKVSIAINQFNQNINSKGKTKRVIFAVLLLSIIVGIIGTICYKNAAVKKKNELHQTLMYEDWWAYDDSTKLYLDFSDDKIKYSGYFGYYLGMQTIATLDYEVVDGNTIKVHGQEIDVELRDDSVVFNPSFVNTDSFSLWMK